MKNRRLLIQALAVVVMGAVALVTAPSTANAATQQLDSCSYSYCVDSCPTKAQMRASCLGNCPLSTGGTCDLVTEGDCPTALQVNCTVPI